MKKVYIIALLLTLTFSLSGCYDLDRTPADQLSSGTFFKTQEHADEAMMGVYNMLQNENVFGLQFSMDCLGGIGFGYDDASYQTIQRGIYDVKSSQVANKWRNLYEAIARANIVLQNVDKCDMSDELKSQYKAEAKFLRGLFYFTLMDFFGGVPIYDETFVVADNFNKMMNPRNSKDEVRTFVLKDLDDAIAGLPEQWNSSNYGRATKYAAIALKGKVLLYNKQYQEAADCFQQVIGSGKFALYKDYAGLFKPGGDENSEMIFAIQNMGGVGTDHGMPMAFYMGTRETYGSDWNNVMVAQDFVDSYEYKDGRPFNWDDWFPGVMESKTNKARINVFRSTLSSGKVTKYAEGKEKLLEMYQQRDPRMMATVILPYTTYKGWYANAPEDCEFVIAPSIISGKGYIRVNQNFEAYLWRKFVPEYDMDGAINNRADTPINFPLIRYADVLLMMAECENELGHQDLAVSLINQVRERVGMPGINSGPDYLKANSKEEVFERIKHERAVELAGEGHSFSDLKRWGLLETLNGRGEYDITGKFRYTRSVTERDYLWPIPADEREKNPNLEQNPGW